MNFLLVQNKIFGSKLKNNEYKEINRKDTVIGCVGFPMFINVTKCKRSDTVFFFFQCKQKCVSSYWIMIK